MTYAIPAEVVCAFGNSEVDLLAAAIALRNNFRCKSRAFETINMAIGETAVLQPLERTLRRGGENLSFEVGVASGEIH